MCNKIIISVEIILIFLAVLSLLPSFFGVWHIGVWFPSLVFILLFFALEKREYIMDLLNSPQKALVIIPAVILTLCFVFSGVLSVIMLTNINSGNTKNTTVVVLGCQIKGEKPSLMLQNRLDKAYEILSEDNSLICIVSGGQGDNEDYPESQVMKQYLVEKGISPDRIIEENASKNTYENIRNSKEIIEELGLQKDITVVTDGFHQTRAKLIFQKQGMTTSHASSDTPWYLAFSYWVREWFALCKTFVFGQ